MQHVSSQDLSATIESSEKPVSGAGLLCRQESYSAAEFFLKVTLTYFGPESEGDRQHPKDAYVYTTLRRRKKAFLVSYEP